MLKNRLPRMAWVALSLFGMAATSCSESNPWLEGGETGGIAPVVKPNLSVVSAISTRAEEEINGPAPEEFSLRISKSDGSFSKEWKSINTFSEDEELRAGDYLVEAFYGDKAEEGAARPAFYGFTNVKVMPGEVTPVEIEAELANSMVSMEYTDAFRNYFKTYSVQLHSDKGGYVDVPAAQTEPTFVHPGRVSVTVNFTKWDGAQSSIQPAAFTAEARHHYNVKLDVNRGDAHSAQLVITFDDAVEEDPVVINLDDLGKAPAPEIAASVTEPVELLQGTKAAQPMKFTITAYGGLTEANVSTTWATSLSKSFDLCKLDASQQALIADKDGFIVTGIFGNASKMAVVDLSDVVSRLPNGTHTVTMQVKDALTQVSEPVSMTVNVTAVQLNLVSVEDYTLNTTQAFVNITYNGSNPKEELLFKATDDNGSDKECEIVNVETTQTGEGAYPLNSYRIELKVPACFRGIPIKLFQKAAPSEVRATATAKAIAPDFEIETDVYAKRMLVRATDATDPAFRKHLKIRLNGEETTYTAGADGVIRITGLTSATTYSIKAALGGAEFVDKGTVTTEAETPVPNGDFTKTSETININPINSGGKWSSRYSLEHYVARYTTTAIVRSEPVGGWASVNQKTCYAGSNPKNTWFMVPSTYMDENAVVLRSVAYDHNGEEPGRQTHTSKDLCNRKAPSSFAERAAGELFLGTYSFDGSEHRVDGVEFSSRPKELLFNCQSYKPYGNDQGIAKVAIYAADGSKIASGEAYITASSSGDIPITLKYSCPEFGAKAAKLEICFQSSKSESPETNTPEGVALVDDKIDVDKMTVPANQYKALSTGSELKISNVRFTY